MASPWETLVVGWVRKLMFIWVLPAALSRLSIRTNFARTSSTLLASTITMVLSVCEQNAFGMLTSLTAMGAVWRSFLLWMLCNDFVSQTTLSILRSFSDRNTLILRWTLLTSRRVLVSSLDFFSFIIFKISSHLFSISLSCPFPR